MHMSWNKRLFKIGYFSGKEISRGALQAIGAIAIYAFIIWLAIKKIYPELVTTALSLKSPAFSTLAMNTVNQNANKNEQTTPKDQSRQHEEYPATIVM